MAARDDGSLLAPRRGARFAGAAAVTPAAGAVVPAHVGWCFAGPALAAIGIFFLVPVAVALALGLTDFDLYALADPRYLRFVGLENYAVLLASPRFWRALGNTLYFCLVGGPLSIAVSLGAALLVEHPLARAKAFFRAALFVPVVTTLVAAAVVWRYTLEPRFGLLDYGLGLLGIAPVDWLGDPRFAMPAIILMAVWKNFGFNMVIFVAGLQNVPAEIVDAARIDGAGPWQRFRWVTLPMLGPTFLFVSVTTFVGYLQLFSEPYVMTRGGPADATLSIVLYMYEEGFRWWNMGYAAAVAFVLFVLVLVATAIQLALAGRGPR